MSYCRFSDDSDVYVYEDVNGGWTCCACGISDSRVNVPTRTEMITHLEQHRAQGQLVPQYALDRMRYENAADD